MTKTVRFLGVYRNRRQIEVTGGKMIMWDQLSSEVAPLIPYGTPVEMVITFEERDYLHGSNGIVWATYDLRQAETVRSALLAQDVACEVREESLDGVVLYLLAILEGRDVEAAIDFIWREKSGLCLQPDWSYPAGSENASFQKWLNDV